MPLNGLKSKMDYKLSAAAPNRNHPDPSSRLFDLLLWSQLVGVATLLLSAVGCTGVQPCIAPIQTPQP